MAETLRKLLELIQSNTTFAIMVAVTFLVIILLSLTAIFYKIRVKAWKGLIPVYNIMVLLDVLEIPVWMILVMFIPFVNFIGLPVMLIIIGWKLGSYCRKGLLMRLGLCLLPPLFIPILSLCYIDIDGTGDYVEIVKVPEGFSLDVVEVSDVQPNLSALSLVDTTIMEDLAPKQTLREAMVLKEPPTKKNNQTLSVGPNANEIEDLNKVLPTADDLTMDYASLYTKNLNEEKPVMIEEPVKTEEIKVEPTPIEPPTTKEVETLDYSLLYKNESIEEEQKEEEQVEEVKEVEEEEIVEEPIPEEEPKIIIHDVVLEAAEPVTENLGPIPINRRYDYQTTKREEKEEKKEESEEVIELKEIPQEESSNEMAEINPLTPPVIAPLIKNTEKEEVVVTPAPITPNSETVVVENKPENVSNDLPMQAINPLDMGNAPTLASIPELTLPSIDIAKNNEIENTNVSELQGMREISTVENGTSINQIVSMNIAEPSQLPVGVLTKPPGKEEEKPPVAPPMPQPVAPQPQPTVPTVNPNMTREEAMGFRQRQNYFINPNPMNSNAQMMQQPNSYRPQTTMNQPNNGINNMIYNQQMQQQMGMMNQPRMQQANSMPQQPMNAASIFQVNAPNGSLLRPVENKTPVAEKICPVCGVKLKQETPVCIMCGYKF